MHPGSTKTVLVIEDDRNTANLIAVYLKREGFRTLTSADGEAGLEQALGQRPDLVILDLMLPKLDGWEVCRRLRQRSEVPVIMLTARAEEVDRVAGLTLGGDDYVVKPFSPWELMARVRAVLRRAPLPDPGRKARLSHADVVLDLDKRQLRVAGRPVARSYRSSRSWWKRTAEGWGRNWPATRSGSGSSCRPGRFRPAEAAGQGPENLYPIFTCTLNAP